MKRIHKTTICLLSVLALVAGMLPAQVVQAAGRAQDIGDALVVVIDAGHGGENLGAKDYGTPEKDLTLVTAQAIYDELTKYDGVQVFLTRTTDVDLSLEQRAQFAKDVNADFLFSVHYNASESHKQYGSEVLVSTQAPYNAYGYQFGTVCLSNLSTLGLYNRGVKAREGDSGDYYGLMRESSKRGIPSAIIEHCYLDSDDHAYADTVDELKKFGQIDAKSVAQYFGLKSTTLGVDYSNTDLVEVKASEVVPVTISDGKGPDECEVSLWNNNPTTGDASIAVHGFDTNAAILYYEYSLDGGMSFTPLYKWPNANALLNMNDNDFNISFNLPKGSSVQFVLRCYNMFDYFTTSNVLDLNSQVLATEYAQGKPITPVMNATDTSSTVVTPSDNVGASDTITTESSSVAGAETTTATEEATPSTNTTKTASGLQVWGPVLLLAAISLIIVMLLVLVIRLFLLEKQRE